MERTESLTAASAPAYRIGGSYIDWPAVLGGAVVAAATATLFAVFGAALGLTTVSADPGEGSVTLLLIVTAVWTVVSLIAAYLAGGYVAGRMRRRVDDASADEVSTRDGINGLVVWGLGMLVTAWMAAGALGTAAVTTGNAVGGVAQATGAALGGAAEAVGTAVADDETTIGWIGDSLLRTPPASAAAPATGSVTGTPPAAAAPEPAADTGTMGRQSTAILANVLRTGEISEEDSAYLVAATARTTGLSTAEVQARVDQAIAATQEARAEAQRQAEAAEAAARDAAETARISTILTAFLLAAASLVAGAAAVAGAVRGGRHRDEGRVFGGLTYRI